MSANAVKIQDTLGYHHKNGGALVSFGLSMLLLPPTDRSPSGFSSSHDNAVQVSNGWWLQHPDFCQSEMSQSFMTCLCMKNKTKARAAECCLCLHFS